MDIDPTAASALGFPKPEYVSVERERRWLCRAVPTKRVARTEIITDLYVTGTQLRLRDARPAGVGAPMLRLSRKAEVDLHTRLITSIHLPEGEFEILAAALKGARIHKLRHRLHTQAGISMLVDEFQGPLSGLLLVEAEFTAADALAAFPTPDFAVREVTDDARYRGGNLAVYGLPQDPGSASDS